MGVYADRPIKKGQHDTPVDPCTLFVRNLPFNVTQQSLEDFFGEIGPVRKVSVIKKKGTRPQSLDPTPNIYGGTTVDADTKGMAFVRFAMDGDAESAIKAYQNSEFQGRALRMELARMKKNSIKIQQSAEASSSSSSSKNKTNLEEQASSSEDHSSVSVEDVSAPKAEDPAKAKLQVTEAEEDRKAAKAARKAARAEKRATKVAGTVKGVEGTVKRVVDTVNVGVDTVNVGVVDTVKPLEPETPAAATQQSERNARRRKHRQMLREMEDRKHKTKQVVVGNPASASSQATLVLTGFPQDPTVSSKKKILKKVKSFGKIDHFALDLETGKATMTFRKSKDLEKALGKLQGFKWSPGCALVATKGALAVEEAPSSSLTYDGHVQKRLIVRNLGFQVLEKHLRVIFEKFGTVEEVKVVRTVPTEEEKENEEKGPETERTLLGKSRGFGFVQFESQDQAMAALEGCQGHVIQGRAIVVDISLPKTKYLETIAPQIEKEEENEQEENEKDEEEQEESEDAMEVDQPVVSESEEDLEEEPESIPTKPMIQQNTKNPDSYENLQRTIFLRNISFQSSESSIKEYFDARFGAVEYARIVMDHASGLSKGTAFVRFEHADSATAAIDAAKASQAKAERKKDKKKSFVFESALGYGLELDGRQVDVSRAVNRGDASRLQEDNVERKKTQDKRNLYLLREGQLQENDDVPELDLDKRRRTQAETKEKLKNPMFFISPTRLVVRSVAYAVTDAQLKLVFREAAIAGLRQNLVSLEELKPAYAPLKSQPVKLVSAKMVHVTDPETREVGPSRGFGFVEFTEHMHALAALREVNNNPKYTHLSAGGHGKADVKGKKGKIPRLLVEFAVENHAKVQLHQKRQVAKEQRQAEKLALRNAQAPPEDQQEKAGKPPTLNRGAKQRQKKRKMREAGNKTPPTTTTTMETVVVKAKKPSASIKDTESRMMMDMMHGEGSVEKVKKRRRKSALAITKEDQAFDSLVKQYKSTISTESTMTNRWFE